MKINYPSPFRLDGYYIVDDNYNIEDATRIFFFYENGVFSGGAYYPLDSLRKYQNNLKEYITRANRSKTNWGIYVIDGLNISLEKWSPSSGGPMRTFIKKGFVLNDTTLLFSAKILLDTGFFELEERYLFKKFSPKPDSTNRFIK